jgi:hypothetical protein
MDLMEEFRHESWTFVCSAEQLPDGLYHPVVRYRCPPSNVLRTLAMEKNRYGDAPEALLAAKELAVAWLNERQGDGRGSD